MMGLGKLRKIKNMASLLGGYFCRYFFGGLYMGVSLNGGFSPHFTSQVLMIFSRKNPWVCWGNNLGNTHIVHIHVFFNKPFLGN